MDVFVVIVVFTIVVLLFYWAFADELNYAKKIADVMRERLEADRGEEAHIKLYEAPGQERLAFLFSPPAGEPGYVREIMPMNLKSVDISLPRVGEPFDQIRRVEIWSINHGSNIASLESGFYNTYLEPDYALRANSAKFTKVLTVLPGQHMRADIALPVKKIMLYAVL